MINKLIFIFVFFSCFGICLAQQVASSGGYSEKSDIMVNWVLGGSVSDIPASNQVIINQMSDKQSVESEIQIKVYPNPVTDFINIQIPLIDTGRINIELYNNAGAKVFYNEFPNQSINKVNISSLPAGIYYLKVYRTAFISQLLKTEKIIKQ